VGKTASISCIGRRYEVNQADLTGLNDSIHRKFIFKITDVKGSEAVGSFDGMIITSDKLKALVRKWHTTIEAQTDVMSREGTVFRVFMLAITRRLPGHVKKTCYAKESTVKEIRKLMIDIARKELDGADSLKMMKSLSSETIGKEIEKRGSEIFPLTNCCVRKVKTIKKTTVAEMYEEAPEGEMMEVED
jgi:small subunit ribosomal protein S3Ae